VLDAPKPRCGTAARLLFGFAAWWWWRVQRPWPAPQHPHNLPHKTATPCAVSAMASQRQAVRHMRHAGMWLIESLVDMVQPLPPRAQDPPRNYSR